jgi:hypothetical protein
VDISKVIHNLSSERCNDMTIRHYALKHFLRAAANEMLAEYFQRKGQLEAIEFDKLKAKQVEPVFEAIQQLAPDVRAVVDSDFQNIFALAYAGGVKFMLHKGMEMGLDLYAPFEALRGPNDKAFWVFLHHPALFEEALLLTCHDNLHGWRKRNGLPQLINVNYRGREAELAAAIGAYFKSEGRGSACVVDYKSCNGLHFFFAYPEDYTQSHLHYVNGEFRRGTHNPAFQVILMYDGNRGALDIYHEGSKETVTKLQEIFAQVAMRLDRLEPPKKPVYELDPLKYPAFRFQTRPEWGIEKITITDMCISRMVGKEMRKMTLHCGRSFNPLAVYEDLDIVAPQWPHDERPARSRVMPVSVRICVEFAPTPGKKRINQRTFNLGHSSCNLKYEDRDLLLRQMLVDSGLERSSDAVGHNTEQRVYEPA